MFNCDNMEVGNCSYPVMVRWQWLYHFFYYLSTQKKDISQFLNATDSSKLKLTGNKIKKSKHKHKVLHDLDKEIG